MGVSLLPLYTGIVLQNLGKTKLSFRQVAVIIGCFVLFICLVIDIIGVFKPNIGGWAGFPAAATSILTVFCSLVGLQGSATSTSSDSSKKPDHVNAEAQPVSSPTDRIGTTYRDLRTEPPLTDVHTIQQREKVVRDIYEKLINPRKPVTVMALTHLSEMGKTTIAALVSNYAQKQREAHKEPFDADECWLSIDADATMADIIGTLFKVQDTSLPELSNMSRRQQAAALCDILNTHGKIRLIVLDQFEHVFNQPDTKEWLKALSTQKCASRILLTCRYVPAEFTQYTLPYWQEYEIPNLEEVESIGLLRASNVAAGIGHLRKAAEQCEHHPAILKKLVHAYHQNPSRGLVEHANDLANRRLDMSPELLERVQHLPSKQRALLIAFSVYPGDTVPWSAVTAQIKMKTQEEKKRYTTALEALLQQELIQPTFRRRVDGKKDLQ